MTSGPPVNVARSVVPHSRRSSKALELHRRSSGALALRRRALRLVVSGVAFTAVGCSLLVSGDVPEFECIDSPSACPADMHCDSATRRCLLSVVTPPEETGAPDAPPADADGSLGDGAEASGPRELGSNCRIDAECMSMLCASSTVLTTAITATTGPICTQPCCTSAECPASFVCFNGGTGGGYCVPATLAKRTPPTAGGKRGGLSCTKDAECRSGRCAGSPRTCLDTCCVAGDCGPSSVCRIESVAAPEPSHDVWVCAPPSGTKDIGAACIEQSECKTDLCMPVAGGFCRPSCSNTASCRALGGAFADGRCVYVTSGIDSLKFCETATFPDRLPAGRACAEDSLCQSGFCDAERKQCANVCAKDSDCAANEACRPSAVNTPYLRCVPKP